MSQPSERVRVSRGLSRLQCIVALVLGSGLPAPDKLAAQMADVRTTKLAEGVYAVIRSTRPRDPSDANTLIIINDHDVVVVDGNITPRSTRAVIAEIRKLTAKPVRYVIVTHWHSDHHTGNVEYQRAWPGVEIVAHRNTRADLIDNELNVFKRIVTEDYPAEIARLRGVLSRGTTSDGSPMSDADRTPMLSAIAAMEYFIEEGTTFSPIPPTLTFSDSLTLHRGDRTIALRFHGQGNTRGDITVYLPNERILATGDLVVSPVPFAFGSYPVAWTRTLRAVRALPADVILPGHGEPMRSWAYVDQLTDLLCATTSRVVRAGGASVPVDSLYARVSLDDYAATFAGGVEWIPRAMRGTFTRPAVAGVRAELVADSSLSVPSTCRASRP
jgi:glyoxylase-like metal-dependent hydrolase (beta-lactamase superfamily II)